jgi:hypothetical protein
VNYLQENNCHFAQNLMALDDLGFGIKNSRELLFGSEI